MVSVLLVQSRSLTFQLGSQPPSQEHRVARKIRDEARTRRRREKAGIEIEGMEMVEEEEHATDGSDADDGTREDFAEIWHGAKTTEEGDLGEEDDDDE